MLILSMVDTIVYSPESTVKTVIFALKNRFGRYKCVLDSGQVEPRALRTTNLPRVEEELLKALDTLFPFLSMTLGKCPSALLLHECYQNMLRDIPDEILMKLCDTLRHVWADRSEQRKPMLSHDLGKALNLQYPYTVTLKKAWQAMTTRNNRQKMIRHKPPFLKSLLWFPLRSMCLRQKWPAMLSFGHKCWLIDVSRLPCTITHTLQIDDAQDSPDELQDCIIW